VAIPIHSHEKHRLDSRVDPAGVRIAVAAAIINP
jgi:hypothetical protein